MSQNVLTSNQFERPI